MKKFIRDFLPLEQPSDMMTIMFPIRIIDSNNERNIICSVL